ncbi:putative oxidoreductase [Hordeum vulgare]|nr:putative oxidoreductase [Hordeum vulgare]
MQAPARIVMSGTVETEEEDDTVGWTLPESFPAMHQPSVHECMINENEDPAHVEYEMEEMAAFEIGETFDPNPTKKKKKKGKMMKARGLAFSRFEEIFLSGGGGTLYHETEKMPFAFSHCWILLDGKPKWRQVVADLKAGNKSNDGSSFHQSIGLDDDGNDVVVTNGKATMPKDSRLLMGTKWEKARISRDAAATKMSTTWMGIFSARESKKEERYKIMLGWDQKRVERRLEIEKEKINLEKKEAAIKWELQKAKTFGEIELEKERL